MSRNGNVVDAVLNASAAKNEALPPITVISEDVLGLDFLLVEGSWTIV